MTRPACPRRAPRVALATAAVLLALAGPASAAPQTVSLGERGTGVRSIQERLAALGYLPRGAVSGAFTDRTWHAVVALQGWSGIARDGVVGPQTRAALRRARRPVPDSRATGMEIHTGAQVLLLVRGGRTRRAIHVSTGAGGATPLGRFGILRREAMSWSRPFAVWMPLAQYFSGGYALHEYPVVPAYPASHGCVRVPAAESHVVWRFGRLGMRVWVS